MTHPTRPGFRPNHRTPAAYTGNDAASVTPAARPHAWAVTGRPVWSTGGRGSRARTGQVAGPDDGTKTSPAPVPVPGRQLGRGGPGRTVPATPSASGRDPSQ